MVQKLRVIVSNVTSVTNHRPTFAHRAMRMVNNSVNLFLCGLLGFPSKKITKKEARTHSHVLRATQKMTALLQGMKMARFACGECCSHMALKLNHS